MNRKLMQTALRVLLSVSLYYQIPSAEDVAALRESASINDDRSPLDELARDVINEEIRRLGPKV
jgi:hypothetical protein